MVTKEYCEEGPSFQDDAIHTFEELNAGSRDAVLVLYKEDDNYWLLPGEETEAFATEEVLRDILDYVLEPFDEAYYKVMEPYGALYVQQAKKDWSGSRGYSELLIETQDVDQVDAVSGATWTNKKFKEAVKLALEEAKEE